MKHVVTMLAVVAALAVPALAGASTVPACHWTHYKSGNVTYYVQVCTVAKHHAKHPAGKWHHAGPGNSAKPHIG